MSGLTLTGVTARYGAAEALFGVDLDVPEGAAVALLGRNGMGKTTTVRAICGLVTRGGGIRFGEQDLGPLPPHRIARLGVGLVPEGRRCFAPLTVSENLTAAARPGPWTMARVTDLFPVLGARKNQRASSLSGGEQQMLAIGRALMTNPKLLILDEATEGLAPLVRASIWQAVAQLRAEAGLSLLLIDKSLKELSAVADTAVILERGRSVWTGRMRDLDDGTSERYLGV